jgi:type VI secretion system protein ImpM
MVDPRPGFFGKVTSHGDFVGRRLEPVFQQGWDDWLQAGMQQGRQKLAERWSPVYLSSPIWRFALARGVCGEQAWVGVMMPSVDRVGRQFPLTLAACIDGQESLLDCASLHDDWFMDLEELALSSLGDGFVLEDLDKALCNLGPPDGSPASEVAAASDVGTVIALDPAQDLHPQLATPSLAMLKAVAGAALQGHSLWWTDGSQQIPPCMLVCKGLPAASAYVALLDGTWSTHGWHLVPHA